MLINIEQALVSHVQFAGGTPLDPGKEDKGLGRMHTHKIICGKLDSVILFQNYAK